MVEFELRSKNATASLGDMNSSREVASLQAKVRHLSSKLAEFDVRVLHSPTQNACSPISSLPIG